MGPPENMALVKKTLKAVNHAWHSEWSNFPKQRVLSTKPVSKYRPKQGLPNSVERQI